MSSSEFTLEKVLEYRNADVVDNFCATFALPRDEAEVLFQDVLRWLWLSNKAHESHTAMFVDPTMQLFDEMWHTFILFTRDYAEFCEKYIGHFCHHDPMRQGARDEHERRVATQPDAVARDVRERYTALISLVARELGEDVAIRWFDTYRKKHTREYMRSLHKYSDARTPGAAVAGVAAADAARG